MTIGITFGTFDLLHAGHVLMLKEARTVCDELVVCLQADPSKGRPGKNKPVQSVQERLIQLEGCRYVDRIIVYDTEADVLDILASVEWDVRILGDEYRNKPITGERDGRLHYNSRGHEWSSSELRRRVYEAEKEKIPGVVTENN